MQILQVFFLQDLALSLASLALKIKLFLQDINNLARILQEKFKKIFLQDFDYILQENYLTIFLAISLQDFYVLQEKLHF